MNHRWLLAGTLGSVLALAPGEASAGPKDTGDPGPWSKGTIVPSLGFGAGFGPDIHVLSFGAGVGYFVWHGLAIGLRISDTVYIYRDDFKSEFPGINKTSPTNEVLLLPTLQYVFLRRYRFSPYAIAGVGPVFYNHQRGTIGQWLVGAGAYIGLGGPVALSVGIDFYANFPDSSWEKAFAWDPPPDPITGIDLGEQSIRGCALVDNPCSFNLSPRIGIVIMLGAGKSKRKAKEAEEAPPEPVNPMEESEPAPEPEPEPEPAPEEEVAPEETPVEGEPVEGEPVEGEPIEEPVEGAPPPAPPSPPEDAPPPARRG